MSTPSVARESLASLPSQSESHVSLKEKEKKEEKEEKEETDLLLIGRHQWMLIGRHQWILIGRHQWILIGRLQGVSAVISPEKFCHVLQIPPVTLSMKSLKHFPLIDLC